MKCHYDVLGLAKDCSDEEIKKSYRKLALQWHPDKNPDQAEECTREFHLIQQAYEVLIDPQERAWYDKHREAILKGGLGHGEKYEDNSLDVYQFFNASCYCGFGDDDKGFYAVYGEVFRKISQEDEEYMDNVVKAPEFGNSASSYKEVVSVFYAYWESYCTCKSFVWCEKYDTREAPNRQIRRLMEQDNKKLRDKAKRERNEEVRALVAYVRKRDKRVQAYKKKLEERAAEVARLAEEKKKNARLQQRKNLENYKECAWSSMSELEQQLKQLEMNVAEQFGEVDSADDDNNDDDDDGCNPDAAAADNDSYKEEEENIFDDSLYCIACKKAFKSDKAMDNHNRSKKHAENVSRLLLEVGDDDDDEEDEEDKKDDNNVSDEGKFSAAVVDNVELADDLPDLSQSRSKKKKKKRRQQQKMSDEHTTLHNDCDEEMDDTAADAERCDNRLNVDTDSDRLNPEEASRVNEPAATDAVTVETEHLSSVSAKLKNSKKMTGKSTTRGTAVAAGAQSSDTTDAANSLSCNKCQQTFTSRNKLFEHIKSTGHALQLHSEPVTSQTSASNRDKKKSSRKK